MKVKLLPVILAALLSSSFALAITAEDKPIELSGIQSEPLE